MRLQESSSTRLYLLTLGIALGFGVFACWLLITLLFNDNMPRSVTMPILRKCKDMAMDRLSSEQLGYRADVQYFDFDVVAPSHPEVIGWMKISSRSRSRNSLISLANNRLIYCFPNTAIHVELNVTAPFGTIDEKNLRIEREYGIRSIYVVLSLSGGSYKVYFNGPVEHARTPSN